VIESEQPEPPAWLIPDSGSDSETGGETGSETGGSHRAGAAGSGSRQTLLLVGGGAAILVLVAGLAAFGLYSASTDAAPAHPRPKSAATDPIVLMPTGTEAATPSPADSPSGTTAGAPVRSTPAAAKTTVAASPGKPQVTAASISVEPASVTGPCTRPARYVRVTMKVTITVSVPEVRLRYTVDGGKELGTVMRSRTYTDSWEANAKREAGTYTSVLKVTAPSATSDTATFRYTCG
jgi:hypothetical protein